jgi:uncharacterized membrane protein
LTMPHRRDVVVVSSLEVVVIFGRLAAIAVSLLLLVLAVGDIESSLRPVVALAFFCFVPGFALFGLLRAPLSVLGLALSIATSLAVDTLVAMVMLWSGWSPRAGIAGLALCSAALLGAEAWADRPRSADAP